MQELFESFFVKKEKTKNKTENLHRKTCYDVLSSYHFSIVRYSEKESGGCINIILWGFCGSYSAR